MHRIDYEESNNNIPYMILNCQVPADNYHHYQLGKTEDLNKEEKKIPAQLRH